MHLTHLQSLDRTQELPSWLEPQALINSIEQNKQTSPTLTINRVRTPKEGGKDSETREAREPRKKFSFRREVQCTCCSTFGHDVDEDVCRIGAQVYSAHQFLSKYPDKAKKNARAFAIANNKTKISLAKQTFPEHTPWDIIEEHLLDLAHGLTIQDETDDDRPTEH